MIVLRLGRLSGPTSRRWTTCSACSLSRKEAKRVALIWPTGTHSALTRAGAMGSRESALIVLRAFLQCVALLVSVSSWSCVRHVEGHQDASEGLAMKRRFSVASCGLVVSSSKSSSSSSSWCRAQSG